MAAIAPFPPGIITASVTPMDRDLNPDIALLGSHCRQLLTAGSHGIVLLGTTGEAASFTVSERMTILERIVADGIPPDKMMVGTGCTAFGDTVALCRHALDLGVQDMLVLPPYYYKQLSDTGVIGYFSKVIENVAHDRLRIYYYHIPQNTGIDLNPEVILRLCELYPGIIAGMKDSSGSWEHIEQMINLAPGFRVYAGSEEFLLPTLQAGGAGGISATTNADVTIAAALVSAFDNDLPCARIQQELTSLRKVFTGLSLVGAIKGFLAVQSTFEQWRFLRPPNTLPEDAVLQVLVKRHAQILEQVHRQNGN